jgi:hypothetical protein
MASKRPSKAKQPAVKPTVKSLALRRAADPKLECPGDCDKLTVNLARGSLAGSWLVYHPKLRTI